MRLYINQPNFHTNGYKDNDDYIVKKKYYINIKEQQNPYYSYNDKGTEKQYSWNHFQNNFFPADEQ